MFGIWGKQNSYPSLCDSFSVVAMCVSDPSLDDLVTWWSENVTTSSYSLLAAYAYCCCIPMYWNNLLVNAVVVLHPTVLAVFIHSSRGQRAFFVACCAWYISPSRTWIRLGLPNSDGETCVALMSIIRLSLKQGHSISIALEANWLNHNVSFVFNCNPSDSSNWN